MKSRDICKVLRQIRTKSHNQIDEKLVPGWEYKKLAEVVAYCVDSGYIDAVDATDLQSDFREYIPRHITSTGEDYLDEHSFLHMAERYSKSVALVILAVATLIAALMPDSAKVWLWHSLCRLLHMQ